MEAISNFPKSNIQYPLVGARRQIQADLDQVGQVDQVGEGRSRWKQMIPAPNADLLPSMG